VTQPPTGRLAALLARLAALPERLIVGLMSGTSCDGVDAAVVRVRGGGPAVTVAVEAFLSRPYEPDLRARVLSAGSASTSEIARLDFDVGEAFARAALDAIAQAGLPPGGAHLVGSHGQTVFHEPPRAGRGGATLQLGQADVIALRTGVPTVADFRTADVAAGGHGAPLIPLVDWLLFRPGDGARLMLNLGGIANVTWVTPERDGVRAFDTGPANALIDEIVAAASDGRERVDRNGERALRGRVVEPAVEAFLRHPYFAAAPPKSTGKETFGREAAESLAGLAFPGRRIASLSAGEVDDLLSTAAAATARSVGRAVAFLPASPAPGDLVVSGGGAKNAAVMRMLTEGFAPCPVRTLDAFGMDPDAKEAVGFAVLANETVLGLPGNLPAVTGASRPVVLGKVSAGL
jgi:anhydro-N-acetylmuramic acid kinase